VELNSSPIVGHFGFEKIHERVKHFFFWEFMKKGIHTFATECKSYKGIRLK
jgi:hypothetical protein